MGGTARRWCAAAAAGRRVYVLGGFDERNTALASAECFDPESRAWSDLPPMVVRRTECTAAAASGQIYVLGGHNEHNSILSSAECFDPEAGVWCVAALPPLGTPRASAVGTAAFMD